MISDACNAPAGFGPRRILSNPQDWHCIIFHFICLTAYASAFWLYLHPNVAGITGPWSRMAFVLASALVLGWISGIDVGVNFHNHSHRPIFTSQFLNRWFGRMWTFSGGWPSFFWEYCHVTIHHARLLATDDWTLPRHTPDGTFENFQRYLFTHWPWRISMHLWKDLTARQTLRRRSLRELAIFLALWSIPFWIDPFMAIWLWALPHWIANAFGNVCPARGLCPQDSRQAGKPLHCICVELVQSHHVQYWFSLRAPRPSQGPLVGTPGTSPTPQAGLDRWRSARGALRQLPRSLLARR
jgi:hypothetical protein